MTKPLQLENIMKKSMVIETISNSSKELEERISYQPQLCHVFSNDIIRLKTEKKYKFNIDINAKQQLPDIIQNNIKRLVGAKNTSKDIKNFNSRKKVGIVFSGGPSPGGHNVIAGLFDALKRANKKSILFGFVMGPDGIIEENYIRITQDLVNRYRNLGGFNMLKTGRTKIDTDKKINSSKKTCQKLDLDAIVIVGGDDSNTNAAFLAQELYKQKISVISIPKTIDGDIHIKDINNNILCDTSFGFHTASKAFSHSVSNLCTDASSDAKYWHICKVMGRSASHLALEIAFQTHPNLTIIGEELANYIDKYKNKSIDNKLNYSMYGMSLNQFIGLIANSIVERAKIGKNFGVIVIPEGIFEFINEIQTLIIKLNFIIANYNLNNKNDFHHKFKSLRQKISYLDSIAISNSKRLIFSVWNEFDNSLFANIPRLLQEGLLTKRDSHGNFQFSQVQTEEIILTLVKIKLDKLKNKGIYKIGINKNYFKKILNREDLDIDKYGFALFKNWGKSKYLLLNDSIISEYTLYKTLIKAELMHKNGAIPDSIKKILKKSIPDFKAQTHFYGYDGRGSNPTNFDCLYTYNLGHTAFHLINNNATGQMASILNLNDSLDNWEPIGIPIAPLMHLEERKGKLALVLEKSLVDLESPSFLIFKKFRKEWLAKDQEFEHYRLPSSVDLKKISLNERPITLILNNKIYS